MTEGSSQRTDNRIVLATRNAHKVEELRDILADVLAQTGRELVAVTDFPDVEDVVESGVTFAANATLKAEAVSAATGLPALADDSGLAVDVLGGSPGVFSARWSGVGGADKDRANNELLLAQLGDVPDEHRAAGFVCAAALSVRGQETIVREGRVRGVLGHELRGTNGFGYDPLLVMPDGRTLAEHSAEEKHAISHRGEAFRALAQDIVSALG
ncbi:RdgB/HAM1 family non-canonical purine NTP pyrophosphatase [Ornithinimicrobium ciconiae]|uniref:dITP/XTP pyrophosphatase n=1 Tax=Ornithinimicrobium ciconiae TaxID=2594265 RepID=A0A516GDA7_9MICO|nr:RdgB/HAM1 family non-canonical purine NTP pyrophosphatase [Ornithinimicrobium ciconiae]QDO89487.1 RdgB/HAM1 family non-canonical purine NTP pyrophosphatase [Ornithinimicrobium ciconiae]